ncbi:MAG: cation transporter [Hellea sp.]|nr:cation transporter [Hellea sp.]MDG1666658.1 cation transporter [Hellea sp.]
MKSLKIIGICASIIIFSQSVYAQKTEMNHDDHDHSEMEHNQMNHDDHDHPEMDKESITDVSVATDGPVIVASVNGLVCDFCAQALKKVFQKEEAVKALKVDLDAGEVRIFLEEGQMLSDAIVAKLIRKSGYSLVDTKREGGA